MEYSFWLLHGVGGEGGSYLWDLGNIVGVVDFFHFLLWPASCCFFVKLDVGPMITAEAYAH